MFLVVEILTPAPSCCLCRSSPQVSSPIPVLRYPAPSHSNRHLSQAGECRAVAQNICVDLTLACLPQTLVASLPSDSPQISPFVPTVLFTYEGASPGGQVPSHFFFSFFPLFFSFIYSLHEDFFLVPLGVQGPLLEFSRCPGRIVPCVDVLWVSLWEEMNSISSYCSVLMPLKVKVSFSFTIYFRSCRVTTSIIIFSVCRQLLYWIKKKNKHEIF